MSLATVDRVIHKRGKPRAATVARVMEAIAALNYTPNKAAIQLARGRAWAIGFVVPDFGITFLSQLMTSVQQLEESFIDRGARIETAQINSTNATDFARQFERFAKTKDACVVLSPKTAEMIAVVQALEAQNKPVATLISDLTASGRTLYAGPDNQNMGSVAAQALWPILRQTEGAVVLLKTSEAQEDHNARHAGFERALRGRAMHQDRLKVLTIGAQASAQLDSHQLKVRLRQAASGMTVNAVYATGGATKRVTEATRKAFGPTPTLIATDITEHSRELLRAGEIDFIVASDVIASVQGAVHGLVKKLNTPQWKGESKITPIQLYTRDNLPS